MKISDDVLENLKKLHQDELLAAKREARLAALEEARQVIRQTSPEDAYAEISRLMIEEPAL